MARFFVQHRFRQEPDGYPLVQLGPGIFSLNETEQYETEDFRGRAMEAMNLLYSSHPNPDEFHVESLQLRYINSEDFDFENDDTLEFLRSKLGVSFSLPNEVLQDLGINSRPDNLIFQAAFRCSLPPGVMHVRFATGEREKRKALIWETIVTSAGNNLPLMPDEFTQWFTDAHRVADQWFWALIHGDLERKYRGA
jgi:uncharacterized protein (TIGR04255 family)